MPISVGLLFSVMLASAPGAGAEALIGEWGGDQAQLTLTTASGVLVAGCSQGRFKGPIVLDARGRFDVAGAVDSGRTGPQRADVAPGDALAQFSGAVQGESLRLTVRSDAGERTYVLTRGAHPKIVRCL